MTPDMTPERTSTVPYPTGRTVRSAAREPGLGRVTRQASGPAALLVVRGALWVWSRPRPPRTAKRRPDMPTLAGGRGLHVERTVTVERSPDKLHVHRYLRPLLERIRAREIDPAFVVSHRLPLSRAPEAYRMWNDKTDDCTKIVLDPAA